MGSSHLADRRPQPTAALRLWPSERVVNHLLHPLSSAAGSSFQWASGGRGGSKRSARGCHHQGADGLGWQLQQHQKQHLPQHIVTMT